MYAMGSTESNDIIATCNSTDASKEYAFKLFRFTKCITRGEKAPKPRSGHRIVCDNVSLYSYGGYNPKILPDDIAMRDDPDWQESRPLFKEIWKLNFGTLTWEKLSCKNIPNVLASNAVALTGKILMVFGGTGVPFGAHCSCDLFLCDLSKKCDWEFLHVTTRGEVPPPEYGQAIVIDSQNLYTIGGTTGYDYSADIHCLNLETKIWEQVYICKGGRDEPSGRYRHELGFHGPRIYVLGGGTAEDAFGFEEIPVFNLQTRCWESVQTKPHEVGGYPSPRRCHSCVQVIDEESASFFIIGGFNSEEMFSDMWKLDLATLQWHCIRDSLPHPVYFHSSAITPNGKVYTFGGIVHKSTHRTADVYSVWVKIPKLKEICWEAVLQYYPDLHTFAPKTLLKEFGIPVEFVQRIILER